MAKHRVVIVGGGFGGLQTTLNLKGADVDITIVDRRNFHLFQPLAYQVATGALATGEVAYPLRSIFRKQENVRVMLAEATGFDLDAKQVKLRTAAGDETIGYDTLVVGGGSKYNYFGHPEWQEHAAELKTLEGALHIRAQILRAFEEAEVVSDPVERERLLTFVIVGAGPTGAEMAGQIAEIARDTRREFRVIDTWQTRVLLVEAGPRVLAAFPPRLSKKAAKSLESLGVTVATDQMVTDIDADGVTIKSGEGEEKVRAGTVIWAAGVLASSVANSLAEAAGAEQDKVDRLLVEPDLTLPGYPDVLAIGDMVQVKDGDPLPGVAPVAMQMGRYAARSIKSKLRGGTAGPFKYKDKGNLATLGRARAIAELPPGLRVSGFIAWVLWLAIHLWYLVGFQNRVLVFTRWGFSFLTHGRGTRLITGDDKLP
ncbi:NAD(P)/FAD-dependent oxidoreductase [Solirubrobacter phytolaccae]|uniref:NADH:ubiquinone reductase (non-electrogenic) n=1 Tax=Solirubrobacter phytolaccae TaxID=1404360 RepID=A0A9X3N4E6_9ACTN|nr:NAD(P)/FAD-dependent oxidoreductase [Solirubrobacter phytolaccae]MDA0179429.1 NAD(P)/FAD-dependent oxidoreductase [Solirubrobacter phytolaccae]